MKQTTILVAAIVLAMVAPPAFAQLIEDSSEVFAPVSPEAAGLTPLAPATIVSGGGESNGIAISSDGKIVTASDDGSFLRISDKNLNALPWPNHAGSDWTRYYNDDGTPNESEGGWGLKVKGSWFSPEFGYSTTTYGLETITSLTDTQVEETGENGDFPAVQLFNGDGSPILPVRSGVPTDFAEAVGDIRLGGWDFLSNGGIAVAGESRQDAANVLPPINGGPGKAITIATLGPNDQFPATFGRMYEGAGPGEMWHGLTAFEGGFAVRCSAGGPMMRFFNNDGTPKTGDIFLSAFGTEDMEGILNVGGRGDSVGFHSNGNDKILLTCTNAAMHGNPLRHVYAGVFNTSGELVVGPIHATGGAEDGAGYEFTTANRVDGAIHPDGKFVCVWTDEDFLGPGFGVLLGRIFDADGTPLTNMFSIDDRFVNEDQPGESRRPRVAWRSNVIAVVWASSSGASGEEEGTVRTFEYGDAPVDDFMLY